MHSSAPAPTSVTVAYNDSPSLDAFSRLRVSMPLAVSDAQFTHDLQPLVFEGRTNGSGATVTHDSTNRCALHTFSSTPTGGYALMRRCTHRETVNTHTPNRDTIAPR